MKLLNFLFGPKLPRMSREELASSQEYSVRMARRGVENHPHMATGKIFQVKYKRIIALPGRIA